MANKKLIWLLILQGWTMLWVVIGHAFLGSLEHKENWPVYARVLMDVAYSFHMPLFMLISGYLFYRTRMAPNGGGISWKYWPMLKEKLERLMIPFVFFTIVAFLMKMALPSEVGRVASLGVKEVINAFLYPYDNPMREMWFIATLMWMFLLMPVWKAVLANNILERLAIPLLLALHLFHPEVKLFCIGYLCKLVIWFYLGLVISKEAFEERFFCRYNYLTMAVGIGLYALGVVTHHDITTFGGILFSFGLAYWLSEHLPSAFCSFRYYTYQIFLMGIFGQMFIKMVYRHVHVPYIMAYVVCILVGLYLPVIISKLLERMNWMPLLLCVGLKKKKSK